MFDQDAENSIIRAARVASSWRHEFICVEHLLYALLEDTSIIELMIDCEVECSNLRNVLEDFFTAKLESLPKEALVDPGQSLGFQRVLQRAILHNQYSSADEISCGDLLAALFTESESHAVYFLKEQGLSRLDILESISHEESIEELQEFVDFDEDSEDELGRGKEENPLKLYTTNLNQKAEDGKLDPLIGREKELQRAIQILCRRTKNNPLFVGDQGVGKTAVVEGLASRLVEGKVPAKLQDLQIFSLDLGSLLAGTRYRGDFEKRLKGVVKCLEKIENSVLFIDEIHTLIGAGSTSGSSVDAANLLKPALSANTFRCIGSTTFEEYKNNFKKDPALSRRFLKIDVKEPSVEETIEILKGLRSYYEEHHAVSYEEKSLVRAAELSKKHLLDQFLPDKAIDVIDEAGAVKALGKKETDTQLIVTPENVEQVVATMARIPAATVSSSEKDKLSQLGTRLRQVVFGQDEALNGVVKAIKRSRAGLGREKKPVGSFLFAGPTGVGKTEVARQLASVLGLELIRFDMSEYMEKHSVSRLVGAPPGYVGYDQGGLLTDAVTRNPHSILLLDEIEKAHPDIYNILLQVMDNASLTDTNGRIADFSNVILIMTSNVGSEGFYGKPIGFSGKAHSTNNTALEKTFRPEFRNRLDMIARFNGLSEETIHKVIDKFITEIDTQLLEKNVSVILSSEARTWLAENGFDARYGARSVQRIIQQQITDPLAEELLFGKLENGGTARIEIKDDALHIKCEPSKRKKKSREQTDSDKALVK